MIPADLLFRVEPILSIYSIQFLDFFLIVIFSIILMGVYFFIKRAKKNISAFSRESAKSSLYTLPSIEDRDFEGKSARIIRTIIGYPEKMPEAHTAREISNYT
jgi:hypothetical protein